MKLFKRVFGMIDVVEDDKYITVTGVKTRTLAREMMREWSTSRIETQMFTKFSGDKIEFPKFFAPEVAFMLRALVNKRGVANRRNVFSLLNELYANTWLKDVDLEHPSKLDYSRLKLFVKNPLKHQSEFFEVYDTQTQAYKLDGFLLDAAPGSGKTLTNLMLAELLRAELVVVVAPKNSIYRVWNATLQEDYRQPQRAWIPDEGAAYDKQRFIVTHYEALDKVLQAVKTIRNPGKVFVILDESHNMNSIESERTQNFLTLCKVLYAHDISWSSGTPLKALGKEAIPLLKSIDPLFTPEVEERFKKIYGRNATRALDILSHRMGLVRFKVEKGDVVDNKPTDHQVNIKIPNANDYTLKTIRKEMEDFIAQRMTYYAQEWPRYKAIYDKAIEYFLPTLSTPQQRKEYEEYKRVFEEICRGYDPRFMAHLSTQCNRYELNVILPTLPKDLREPFKDARSVVKYVELKVMGEALGGVLGKKRMQCHLDMIPHMKLDEIIEGSDKKVVIFTSYVKVADTIAEQLTQQKYRPEVVHGETNKNLPAIVQRFGDIPEINPLIATFQSLSTAVPLVMANTAVMTNQPFRDADLAQARARIDRLGQDTPVHYFNMLLDTGEEPNISTRTKDILEWSKAQVSAILGKPVDEGALGGELAQESLEDGVPDSYDFAQTHNANMALEDLLLELADF